MQNWKTEAVRKISGKQGSKHKQSDRRRSDYKCDNCGYPHGGVAKVITVNEQLNMGEDMNIKGGKDTEAGRPTD